MKKLLVVVLTLSAVAQAARAQAESAQMRGMVRSIGIQLGYADTYVDERIRDHPTLAGFIELSLLEEIVLKIQLEYFQTNKSLPWEALQYKGAVYTAHRPQVWKNWTLGAVFLQRVSSISSVGIGLGAEWIKVRRISYKDPIFWVNFFTDTPYINDFSIIDKTETLLKPSVSVLSDLQWEIDSHFSLVGELRYKISFVGKKYGYTALNSQNTYSISAGLKYRF